MNWINEKYNHIESFDPTKIDELVQLGNDIGEDVVSQLIDVHFETTEASICEMEAGFKNSDVAKLKSTSHKLKSSCGTLGLNKLHSFCHDLENYLSHDQADTYLIKNYLDCIVNEYDKTKKQLETFRQTRKGA